jgi:hypothetical protein
MKEGFKLGHPRQALSSKVLEYLMKEAKKDAVDDALSQFSYTYKGFSDAELKQYIAFSKTSGSQIILTILNGYLIDQIKMLANLESKNFK